LLAWAYFAFTQLISLDFLVLGLVILIPFCLWQGWDRSRFSIKDGRPIDQWTFRPLNFIYDNPEDGVSGQCALVWLDGTTQGPYMPGAWAPWRAYCWSALRNSTDNLKYAFAWKNGPYASIPLFGRTLKAGWKLENGVNVPVLSLKK
jgi:hypothetical protein